MTLPETHLYTFLFEHFPPPRAFRLDTPLLFYRSSSTASSTKPSSSPSYSNYSPSQSQYRSLSLLELRQRVDDASSGLWNDTRIGLAQSLGEAKFERSGGLQSRVSTAVILVDDEQDRGIDRVDYLVAFIACLKLGLTVCFMELDKKSLKSQLDIVRPLLAFAPSQIFVDLYDCGLQPTQIVRIGRDSSDSHFTPRAASGCSSLSDLEARARSSSNELAPFPFPLKVSDVSRRPALLVLQETRQLEADANAAYRPMFATHANIIAGIISSEHLFEVHGDSLVALDHAIRSSKGKRSPKGNAIGDRKVLVETELSMVLLRLVEVVSLTLSFMLPIWQGRPTMISGFGEDTHDIHIGILITDGTAAARIAKHTESPSFKCLIIMQPGAGHHLQQAILAVRPTLLLFNGYAPKESTGLTHLTGVTRNDLTRSLGHVMLGVSSSSPSQTLVTLSSKRRNSIAISGPTMMATSMSSPQQTSAYIEVDDTASLDFKGCLHLLSSQSCSTALLAEAQDLLVSHPRARDCALVEINPSHYADTSSISAMVKAGPLAFLAPALSSDDNSDLAATSKAIAHELTRYIKDVCPTFKAMKASIILVDRIPPKLSTSKGRLAALENSRILGERHGTRMTKTSSRMMAPKGQSLPASTSAYASQGLTVDSGGTNAGSQKKSGRDSKRRATHSQIERRRREKINDRLVTLRVIVPACAAEVEERKRQRREEEEEWRKIAAGEISAKSASLVGGAKGKRKRNRKKATSSASDGTKEEELGLHKLEVLTHTIDYIYELQAHIEELETGHRPARVRKAEDKDFDVEQEQARKVEEGEEGERDEEEDDDLKGRKFQSDGASLVEDAEDGSGSDEGLEMAEWQGIRTRVEENWEDLRRSYPRRRTNDAVQMEAQSYRGDGRRDSSVTRLSGDSTRTSPAVMSLSAESPMFSGANSSSASAYTSLTSPLMSLSAESPILRSNAHEKKTEAVASPERIGSMTANHDASIAAKTTSSFSPRPSSSKSSAASSGPSSRKNPGTFASSKAGSSAKGFPSQWQMLPAPILPLTNDIALTSPSSRPLSTRSDQSHDSYRQVPRSNSPPSGQTAADGALEVEKGKLKTQQRDAELLLSLSTSPEVLRPMSSVRRTFTDDGLVRFSAQSHLTNPPYSLSGPDRLSKTASWFRRAPSSDGHFSVPVASPTEKMGARSAPGGAHASLFSSQFLASPPLLALDATSTLKEEEANQKAEDVDMADA